MEKGLSNLDSSRHLPNEQRPGPPTPYPTGNHRPSNSESGKSSLSSGSQTGPSKPGTKTPVIVPVHQWFVTFMCMNIPIIGWIYLITLSFRHSQGARRDFARAYLLYKLVFLSLTLVILAILIHRMLPLLDQLLSYIEML